MAVTKITWENKTGIQNDTSVARKNKVTDEDMNEIKQVVNNNGNETMQLQTFVNNMQRLMQEIASSDLTNKNNISNLQSRTTALEKDNTQNKSDISTLKSDNQTNKSNISNMQSLMKEMAASDLTNKNNITNLQNKVTSLETDNTQNKANIENNTNKNIEQDELISKLRNAALNAETEESKSIHVEDANKFGQLEILGNHEQKTREGYNKYDYLKNLVDSIAGLTVTKDDEGYVIVNGTPEDNYAVLSTLVDITDNLEDGQTYTMWAENHYGNNDAGIYLQVRITKISDGTIQYLTTGNINRTFTVDKSLYTYKANIQTGTIALSGTFNNSKNRFMIYKGTDEKEFELYGASPSPKYPSPVVCLEGSTKISKINRNVLEKPENSTSSGVGITVNYENGKYIINGMTTEGCYLKLNKELLANTFAQSSNWQKSKLKPGEYVFSIKTISGNTNSENINIFLRNATSKAVFNQEIDKVSKPGSLSKSFLIEEEQDYFCYLWMPGSITFTNFTFSVMLEKGTELTELTENQQTDYILNIQQEMLEGDYFIKEDDGWKEVHNWNKYVFSGNESIAGAGVSNVYYMSSITDYIISEENICISNYFKSINNVKGAGSLTDEDNVICFNNNHTNYRLYIKSSQYASLTELKEFLQQKNTEGNPVYVFYKTKTSTKLACTPEQSAVLEELSNLDLFEGVNNIITAEDIALLKLKYALDVKTYVNNQLANVNQQILNIAGGN